MKNASGGGELRILGRRKLVVMVVRFARARHGRSGGEIWSFEQEIAWGRSNYALASRSAKTSV